MLCGFRIVEPDVTAWIDAEGFKWLAFVQCAEKVVSSANLWVSSEVERQEKVGNINTINLVLLVLDGVTHFVPVKYLSLGVSGMRTRDQAVGLGVPYELQRFMRERDRPRLIKFFHELREHESEWNTARVEVVVPQRVVHIDVVPQVDDRVAAKLWESVGVRVLPDGALEAQFARDVPVRLEVMRNLPIDRADSLQNDFVG
jgi:hypothetical protein